MPERWLLISHPRIREVLTILGFIPRAPSSIPTLKEDEEKTEDQYHADADDVPNFDSIMNTLNQIRYPSKSSKRHAVLTQHANKIIAFAQDHPLLFRQASMGFTQMLTQLKENKRFADSHQQNNSTASSSTRHTPVLFPAPPPRRHARRGRLQADELKNHSNYRPQKRKRGRSIPARPSGAPANSQVTLRVNNRSKSSASIVSPSSPEADGNGNIQDVSDICDTDPVWIAVARKILDDNPRTTLARIPSESVGELSEDTSDQDNVQFKNVIPTGTNSDEMIAHVKASYSDDVHDATTLGEAVARDLQYHQTKLVMRMTSINREHDYMRNESTS